MPIMKSANPPEPKAEYEVHDPNCREISGQVLSPGQKTVWLTASEARFFVANGSITPTIKSP